MRSYKITKTHLHIKIQYEIHNELCITAVLRMVNNGIQLYGPNWSDRLARLALRWPEVSRGPFVIVTMPSA